MLEREVSIEEDRLDPGEQGAPAVQVAPTRLHHAHGGIAEVRNRAPQKIRGRDEIGIEHANEIAARDAQTRFQRTRLEPFAIRSAKMLDGQPGAGQMRHAIGHRRGCPVAGVVENLDLQTIMRIVERGNGVEQPRNDIQFVEHRELYCDHRPFHWIFERRGRRLR